MFYESGDFLCDGDHDDDDDHDGVIVIARPNFSLFCVYFVVFE